MTRRVRNLLATAAFLAIASGCWLIHPSVGLIVPGLIVFLALAWSHVRGGSPDA